MFEASPKLRKTAATAVAAGALLVGAETAQAQPAQPEGPVPASVAGPNSVGGVSAGYDPVEKHHHLMSPTRFQTDPTRGDANGGKGGDPSGPGTRARLSEDL